MIDTAKLNSYAEGIGLTLGQAQLEAFDLYAQMLVEWNQKINLTAITQPEEIVVKHFLDSLMLLSVVSPMQGARLVDVGTGAGFPSVPVKIARPDLELTLLDSLNKRILFLKELSDALGQQNHCVHIRAEEAGRAPAYREQHDLATARAVAHLRELSEYCLPLVRVGGRFAALKGGQVEREIEESQKAIRELGGKIAEIRQFSLPDGSARTIVVIEKISQTLTKYPRTHAKIAKYPLI